MGAMTFFTYFSRYSLMPATLSKNRPRHGIFHRCSAKQLKIRKKCHLRLLKGNSDEPQSYALFKEQQFDFRKLNFKLFLKVNKKVIFLIAFILFPLINLRKVNNLSIEFEINFGSVCFLIVLNQW